jgi:cell division protein FtsB
LETDKKGVIGDILEIAEAKKRKKEKKDYSAFWAIVIAFAILAYFYSLIFGQNSISVMLNAKWKKEELLKEYNKLQTQNQKLQKEHFELIQLTPEQDAF